MHASFTKPHVRTYNTVITYILTPHDLTNVYVFLITLKNLPLIPKLYNLLLKPLLFTLSKADFKSMKAQYNRLFSLIIWLIKECNTNIYSNNSKFLWS